MKGYRQVKGGLMTPQVFHAAQKEGEGTIVRCWIRGDLARFKVERIKKFGSIVFKVLEHPTAEGHIEVTEHFFQREEFPNHYAKAVYTLATGEDPWREAVAADQTEARPPR